MYHNRTIPEWLAQEQYYKLFLSCIESEVIWRESDIWTINSKMMTNSFQVVLALPSLGKQSTPQLCAPPSVMVSTWSTVPREGALLIFKKPRHPTQPYLGNLENTESSRPFLDSPEIVRAGGTWSLAPHRMDLQPRQKSDRSPPKTDKS